MQRVNARATLGYIGSNNRFVSAIGQFAVEYADQTERDCQALADAARSGRVAVESGV